MDESELARVANLAMNANANVVIAASSCAKTNVNSNKLGCIGIRIVMCVKSLADDDDDEPSIRVVKKIAVGVSA